MSRRSLMHLRVHKRPASGVAPPIGVFHRRSAGARSFARAGTRAVAVLTAVVLPLGVTHGLALAAVPPTVGNGFTVTAGDLAFILKQIKIAERHAATQTPANLCGTLVGPGPDQIPDILTSYGLRTVDGSCNNLKASGKIDSGFSAPVPPSTTAGRRLIDNSQIGTADQPFPRLTSPVFRDAEPTPPGFGPPGPSSYKQKTAGNNVFDSQPRTISNLIVDQTSTNPAAVAAAGFPVRTQGNPGLFPCTTDPVPPDGSGTPGVPAGCVASHKTLFIPNVTTDVGLSPPYNSLFTFFGQFFDHGVDQTVKSSGTVFVPLKDDDPLRTLGPDGDPSTPDQVPASKAFMVLTRAQNQPGEDGILGTADDVQDANNTDSPWVDQSQTYGSHPSHQVFLREYATNAASHPVSTGKLLGGEAAGVVYAGDPAIPGSGSADGTGAIGTWHAVKMQAAEKLGLQLLDKDVTNIPMIATDPYGNFLPGPARGLPQYVTATGMVEGNTANDPTNGKPGLLVPANVLHFDTPFVGDIAHNADPSPDPQTGVVPVPDSDTIASADFKSQPAGTYDDEMLNAHLSCGDGRCNENIALSSIHQMFHSEHDRLVGDITDTLNLPANASLLADFKAPHPFGTAADIGFGFGGRLFQAARFVTEMEYQHLVFEEFARKVQPAVRPFHVYSPDMNPAVKAEFAHAVYRFGHSMLDDTVARTNTNRDTGAVTGDNSVPLLTAFLNPPEYYNNPGHPNYTAAQAAGAILMGSSDQVGNELDEFVTETLRNNLLGLPLDLPTINMARARSEGVPPLNDVRRQIFGQTNDGQLAPYTSWSDFGQHLKHPESLINFVAAYGLHPTITGATTIAAKRDAARAIVDPRRAPINPGDPPADVAPEDAAQFMFGTDGTSPTCPTACNWTSTAAGVTTTGLDDVDLWVGGLAEVTNLFGGLLGSTFNYVFQTQLESLQDGDRLYYLARTPGLNLRTQLEGNSFSEMIQRNTDGYTHSLKADAFATADCRFELGNLTFPAPSGSFITGAGSVADDPATKDCNENRLLLQKPDGTVQYRQINSVDPSGINGQSVYNGTPGVDRIFGGNDNDTFWGGPGNDIIEGNGGDDVALGGDGNDIITDLAGADVLKGGPGNDAIDGGIGDDIMMGADGNDFLNGGANDNEEFAGPGNDYIIAGQGADAVFGDGGDDWIEGGSGQDLLQGDHGAPFFDDPGEPNPGNDIFVGQVGENDYDAEGGDDMMAQNAAIDRNAGAGGFDWAFHQYDTVAANDDMMINNNLGGLPIQIIINRDRWQETEADSGGPFKDTILGTDGVLATPRLISGGGFTGCDALDQAGVDRIAGLAALLPPVASFPGSATETASLSASGQCPLVGKVWGEGDILLGGQESDTITGRSGDEIIDGDQELQVAISVRTLNPDGTPSATELGHTDLMENPATSGNFGVGTTGMTLQQAVFAGKVDPGQLVNVRAIVNKETNPADCAAGASAKNCDTATYAGPRAQYNITQNANRSVTVVDTTTVTPAVAGVVAKGDGTDTLFNIEQLRFSDQTVPVTVLAAPAAPTIGTATAGAAGSGSATVTWSGPTGTVTSFDVVATPATGTPITKSVPAPATTTAVTGLTPNVAYRFTVRAVNANGPGPFSAASNPVTVAPAPVLNIRPAAPVIGTAVAGNTSATVNWTAPAPNGGPPVTSYSVQVQQITVLGPFTIRTVNGVPATATSTVITGLANGITYQFRVLANNAVGASPASAASNRVTPATPPAAPVIGTATSGVTTDAVVNATARWTPPGNTGGSAIISYTVVAQRMAANGTTVLSETSFAGQPATARTLVTTLPAGNYRFVVLAVNGIGAGPRSTQSNLVTAR